MPSLIIAQSAMSHAPIEPRNYNIGKQPKPTTLRPDLVDRDRQGIPPPIRIRPTTIQLANRLQRHAELCVKADALVEHSIFKQPLIAHVAFGMLHKTLDNLAAEMRAVSRQLAASK